MRRDYRCADGSRVPGVTTVLASLGWKTDGLVRWAWRLGMEGQDYRSVSQAAADAGTAAHALVEAELLGQPLPEGAIRRRCSRRLLPR